MLAIAAVALTAGSVTVALVAPINLLLAVALGPVAGTGAAVLAAVFAAGRQDEDEQDGAERDVETDRMVAALRYMGRSARPIADCASSWLPRSVGRA